MSMVNALITNAIAMNPTTGHYFIVGLDSLVGKNEIKALYGDRLYPAGTAAVYTSITAAQASCIAGNGDVIIVMPGHVETITGAAGIAIATSGVSIVGLGTGSLTPVINFTTSTAAQLTVTAANVTFKNIVFTAGIDAIVAMISVTGTDCQFLNCEFNVNNATMGAILGILTAATADNLVVSNCRFLGVATSTGTTITACIQYEAAVDIQIINSYFTGKMTQAILNVATVLRGLIDSNRFVIATGTKAIAVAAASTPFIVNNRINVASGSTPIIAAAGFVAGNIYSAAPGVTAGTASTI